MFWLNQCNLCLDILSVKPLWTCPGKRTCHKWVRYWHRSSWDDNVFWGLTDRTNNPICYWKTIMYNQYTNYALYSLCLSDWLTNCMTQPLHHSCWPFQPPSWTWTIPSSIYWYPIWTTRWSCWCSRCNPNTHLGLVRRSSSLLSLAHVLDTYLVDLINSLLVSLLGLGF